MAAVGGRRALATLLAICAPWTLACGAVAREPFSTQIVGDAAPAEAPSRWIESRRRLYRKALGLRAYDSVVVPFQVQGYGVDPIERSLLTRVLADGLWLAGQRVSDPEFVEFALGEGERQHGAGPGDVASLRELAESLGTRRLVIGYAGHRGDGRLRITVETYERNALGVLPERPTRVWDRADLPLSHERLPSMVFRDEVDAVVEVVLGGPPRRRPPTLGAPVESGDPPPLAQAFDFLIGYSMARPVHATYMLQFLACLHPPGRERERLYERSLVELGHAKPETPYRGLLEARAWYHLHRRPAARAVLSAAPAGPAEQALLGVLDGDLSRAASLGAIEAPLLALLARVELLQLQREYARPEFELAETLERLREEVPRWWRPLLLRSVIGRFDIPEFTRADLQVFEQRFAPPESPLARSIDLFGAWNDEAEIFMAPRSLVDRLVEQGDSYVLLHAELWQPNLLDQTRLIAHSGDAAVVADVARLLIIEGSPDEALARIERYAPVYADHPQLEALRALALGAQAARAPSPAAGEELRREAERASRRALVWSGGRIAAEGVERDPLFDLFSAEFPLREGWKIPTRVPQLVGLGRAPRIDWVREAELRVDYSVSDPSWLEALYAHLAERRESEAMLRIASASSRRFVGHPKRPAFLSAIGKEL